MKAFHLLIFYNIGSYCKLTPKVKEIKKYVVKCDNPDCGKDIETKKTSGKVQCYSCGERTDLD